MGSAAAPTAVDANAVSQGQGVAGVRPDAERTWAANTGTGPAISLDLAMFRQLLSRDTYREAMRGADSFADAMNTTQAFLADKEKALLQHAKTTDPASADQASRKAADIRAGKSVVGGFCTRSDTFIVYKHRSPKLG
ncbi:hypothetical protein CEY04_21450 [Achromobacter sp. HZ28]|nr:hypothetical protein CEY05_22625 [Achromobacter sp. HZ34]OWT73927.1 hypothetical protein CEY04_21450 [Achromobacter sp. HZ28]